MSTVHSPPPATPRFTLQRRAMFPALLGTLLGAAGLPLQAAPAAASRQTPRRASPQDASQDSKMLTIDWRGTAFQHRWSRDGQHEFTPDSSANLASWRDMLTLNLHEAVKDGEQLATVANQVLGNYRQHGKILQTRSTPRSAERPAEHLIVAVLGTPKLLEAVFARCLLRDGVGLIAVLSHRVYGQAAGPQMSDWLRLNGPQTELALMAWDGMPAVAGLKRLPRST